MNAKALPLSEGTRRLDTWQKVEIGLLAALLRKPEEVETVIRILGDSKLNHKPCNWLFGQMRKSVMNSGEFDPRLLLLQVRSKPKDFKGREQALDILRVCAKAKPVPKIKAAATALQEQLVKRHAMEVTQKGVAAFKAGQDERAIKTMAGLGEKLSANRGAGLPIPKPIFKTEYVQNPDDYGTRIPTGMYYFDERLGGLDEREVGLVIADTGIGKSFMMINFVVGAMWHGKRVLFLDTENTEKVVEGRIHSRLTGIPHERIIEKTCTEEDLERMNSWGRRNAAHFNQLLRVVDLGYEEHTWEEAEMVIREAVREGFAPDLLVWDSPDHCLKDGKKRSAHEQSAAIANGVKHIADSTEIPIWATSQVGGGAEVEGRILTARQVSDTRQKPKNAAIVISLNGVPRRGLMKPDEEGFQSVRKGQRILMADDMDYIAYCGKARGRKARWMTQLDVDLEIAYMQAPPPEHLV